MELSTTPESRAGKLPLIGCDLALDFTNTSSGRGHHSHLEHLRSAENVVSWARHAKALALADSESILTALQTDEGLAARFLKRALALREIIFAIGVEVASRRRAPDESVNALAHAHAACIAKARLTPHGGGFVWSWPPQEAPIEAVLGPIALSALTLLTQADLSRIKQCQGDHCGWLFLDTTKNKSRRWCEMEVCGNRAKQKRHQSKLRKAIAVG
ncbi:MAG TPA: CGNR zinc finger domain-containing protein [Roseiarcus sp.]|jgi:predicted RNA-binding Zn ribbon-like protein|nr:CGNR zinc finger domain-containing protein [Roseiarcus sp.]